MVNIDKQIDTAKRKIEMLDETIGRMMSNRVDMEDRLAALYARKNEKYPSPLAKALGTIMAPGFGE